MPGAVSGPGVSTSYDVPLPERMTALVVADGTQPVVTWTLTDPATGAVVDLTPYADSSGTNVPVGFRLKEAAWSGGRFLVDATATVGGPVVAPVDLTALRGAGIFLGQVAALDANGIPSVLNTFYLVVERSLWSRVDGLGPPTFSEIRLHLRDSSPGENRLLDVRQFDDAEVARCIVQAIEYWNGANPPGFYHTTQSFPYRAIWLSGTIAYLQKLAAEWYRKNRLDYSAGGIQVADLNKADEYDRQADQAIAAFRADVQSRKVSLNMEAGWGSVSSPYAHVGRYGW